jgi:predicted metal-dependent enzyme (double-stranded beta helix superfamily)
LKTKGLKGGVMSEFSIEGFAAGCKEAMKNATDKRQAAKACLEQMLQENETSDVIEVLEAAIPEGADIGEMIVHQSAELTMLYGRIPPRFQSGIHNHTIFACIAQLEGEEVNTSYQKSEDGQGLRVFGTMTNKAGGVISMPAEAIHHIENPNQEAGKALHIYGGDFGAVMDQRNLWSSESHEMKPFTFKDLLAESVKMMKLNDNEVGLDALGRAIPTTKPMIDAL